MQGRKHDVTGEIWTRLSLEIIASRPSRDREASSRDYCPQLHDYRVCLCVNAVNRINDGLMAPKLTHLSINVFTKGLVAYDVLFARDLQSFHNQPLRDNGANIISSITSSSSKYILAIFISLVS